MRATDVMGIIFPNTHDKHLGSMTAARAIGSLPFCGRYRLIDFSLSNLVNAGVGKVGVIARENYQSLADHLGNGRPWDLARKTGGLQMLAPYGTATARVYEGKIDALAGAENYLRRSSEKYVVMCDANLVANIDIEDVINRHIESGADFTVCYANGEIPGGDRDVMAFDWDANGFASRITFPVEKEVCDYSLDVIVSNREKLITLVEEAYASGKRGFAADILQAKFDTLKIMGYKVDTFTAVIDSKSGYYEANMRLIRDGGAMRELFRCGRPIYTKVRDDMPTRYGLDSRVSDSLIADGCVINGDVSNCVLFRGVKVGENTVLRDCIIMQDSDIADNCNLKYSVLDKNVKVSGGVSLCGAKNHPVYISKGESLS